VNRKKVKKQTFGMMIATLLLIGFSTANACTGIRLIAEDGTVVHARTLEFEVDLQSNVIVIPRGYARTGTAPDGKKGLEWKTKYASMGANGAGMPFLFDGLNEKGLAMGLFYHPGTVKYMPYKSTDADHTIAPWELGSWMLENCATTQEVKEKVSKLVVPAVKLGKEDTPPVHYVVHDASGKSIVIEYIKGKLVVYDNPLGVLTNSPSFDWQMTNLNNYVNVSFTPVKEKDLKEGVKLKAFGMGAGMHGIPGDFTPPSRFVRAVAFTQAAPTAKTGRDAILEAFHILNNFDIPKGTSQKVKKDANGNIVTDHTTWTSANDLKAKKFYFRTYDNSQIRVVELMKMDLDAKKIISIPMTGKEVFKELRPNLIKKDKNVKTR